MERRPHLKSARTRRAILEAAESQFAARGYAATRLESVATEVGIRRASIVYYFRGKAELYEAVLDELFGELLEAAQLALAHADSLDQRIYAAVSLWVDYLAGHPSLARILMRDLPDTGPGHSTIQRYVDAYNRIFANLFKEQTRGPLTKSAIAEQIQVGSVITGATLFFIAATPALAKSFDPLEPANIEHHKQHVLSIARHLIGSSFADPSSGTSGTPTKD